jgi:cell division protein FtsI (penicillin-binding protein 3)
MFVFALAVVFKLCTIQFVDGDKYRAMAQKRSVRAFDIPANRGNVYSADGSLLATSIPKYNIGIDAVTSSNKNFNNT